MLVIALGVTVAMTVSVSVSGHASTQRYPWPCPGTPKCARVRVRIPEPRNLSLMTICSGDASGYRRHISGRTRNGSVTYLTMLVFGLTVTVSMSVSVSGHVSTQVCPGTPKCACVHVRVSNPRNLSLMAIYSGNTSVSRGHSADTAEECVGHIKRIFSDP